MVDRPTKKLGLILTQYRLGFESLVPQRDFSPRAIFQCRLSYSSCIAQFVQSHASASVPSLIIPAISLFEHAEILHILIGMGISLHLRLLRFTRVRRPEFPASDNELKK